MVVVLLPYKEMTGPSSYHSDLSILSYLMILEIVNEMEATTILQRHL